MSEETNKPNPNHPHHPEKDPAIEEIVEIVEIIEELDLEEFCKMHGGKPPKARRYRIRVDREKFTVEVSHMTGRQILELAKKLPPGNWLLNQKFRDGHVRAIGLNEEVDFTAAGVERFITLPKDQTEGRDAPRRQVQLPEGDVEALSATGWCWETLKSPNGTWFLVHDYALPPGYNVERASVGVQVPSGYPTSPLDMAFFLPHLSRTNGKAIPAAQAIVTIDGQGWQRWSRHYSQSNPWKPGEYNLITHMALVSHWLERELERG